MTCYADRFLYLDHALVLNFVVAFGRFEFAMKSLGLMNPKKEYADPNWAKMPARLNALAGGNFYELVQARAEKEPDLAYMLGEPPRQQMNVGQKPGWGKSVPVSNTRMLVRALKDTRNNLFHGGKATDGSPGRNQRLISAALKIIEIMLEVDSEIATRFQG